jgi:hypothetical protein
MRRAMQAPASGKPDTVPFYHRGNLAGWIMARPDGRASAVTRDGIALGVFNSESAAASALIAARAL